MGRHEQREQVFKLLFRLEFNEPEDMPKQVKLFFEDDELTVSEKEMFIITDKYQKIQEKKQELDEMIDSKAKGWDTARMGKVEVTILRLALYEILYDEEVPGSVAINEAVEIAKKYGQETSGGFVNAILAKFV